MFDSRMSHAELLNAATAQNERLISALSEIGRLRAALKSFRMLVQEGGVPRYTVMPGAALNSLIEEDIDPLLRGHEQKGP